MELRLASMDTQGERRKAAERKTQIVHNSNTGLPGSGPSPSKVRACMGILRVLPLL